MRAMSFMLAAVGLVALPTPTLAQTCPPGELMICAGTRKPHQLRPPNSSWDCTCVRSGTGESRGGGKVQQQKKNVPTVRPNRTPGSND